MDEKTAGANNGAQPVKMNYGGLDEDSASLKRSRVVIVPAPYEKTTTYKQGTKRGPEAIIAASKNMELYDDELNQETYRIGIHTLDPLSIGDLTSEAMVGSVQASVLELLKANKFPVLIGGEHSVSVGAVNAFKEVYPDISVLQLDAHYDLRDEWRGSKLSHACVGRRIQEICPLVQAGVRSLSKEEKDFLSSSTTGRIKTFSVYDILETPLWKDAVSRSLTDHVYVTVDLDVFDPSLVPAVGTPEPGGIGWYEILDLLKEVSKDKKIVGFDVVELCPIEGQVNSDFLAAKLIYRMLGYTFLTKK